MERLYRVGNKTDWQRLMTAEQREMVELRCREFDLERLFPRPDGLQGSSTKILTKLSTKSSTPPTTTDDTLDDDDAEEDEEEEEEVSVNVQASVFVFSCLSPSNDDEEDASEGEAEEKAVKRKSKWRKRPWWTGRARKAEAKTRPYVSGRGSSSESD